MSVYESNPGLLSRFWLAWVCFFRVLFDGEFAGRILRLRRGALELKASAASPAGLPESADVIQTPAESPLAKQPNPAPADAAFQLLSLLQREGRFIDFVKQDITTFQDADVGAAARVVHQGCRKAFDSLGSIAAIRAEAEGSKVTVEAGFAHAALKLVGNVQGAAPYQGTLRHRGWRVESFQLPRRVGDQDANILAPAELEL